MRSLPAGAPWGGPAGTRILISMSRSPIVAALLLAGVVVAWGAIPLIVRGDVPWQQLVAARVWLGAATLLAILAIKGKLRIPATYRGRVALSGALLAGHWSSFFLSLRETTVAIALAILYMGPVLASVVAPRVLGERPHPRVYAGLAISIVGVLAVVRPGGETSALGLTAAVLSGLTLAGLMLLAKPAAESLGGLVVAAGELAIASIVLAPFAVQAAAQSLEHWRELLILGVILTGLAGWVYWEAMGRLPVATVSVIMYIEPASAVVWAMLFLSESPDLLAWVGIVLVLTGGLLAGSARSRYQEVVSVPAAL